MAGSVARVASLEGQAWAKSPDGTLRPLAVGDTVTADEVVITATGAHIELDFGDGHPVSIAGGQEVTLSPDLWQDLATDKKDAAIDDASVQEALRVLDNGGDLTDNLEETAAGLTGGGANEGHGFVELTRVVEETSPQAFEFGVSNPDATNTTATLSSGIVANHAPQVGDQSVSGDEDSIISGQIVATDLEGDNLTYSLVGQPANGTLVLDSTTGGFTYTPNANYNGPDSFVVAVIDPAGNTTTTTVSIGVNPVNDAPVTADQSLVTAEDTAISGVVAATDVDGDPVTFSLTAAASHGIVTLDPTTGAFVYTPSANFNGSDSFVVTLSDGKGGTTTSTIAIGVTPVNDAPVAINDSLSTLEDTPLSISPASLLANDTDLDGDTLTITGIQNLTNGTVTLVGGNYLFTPTANYNGPASFTYTLSDGKGGTSSATVNITVTAVNDAPETNPASATGNEDDTILVNFTGSDADGTVVGYTLNSLPTQGTLYADAGLTQVISLGDQVTGPVYFKPAADWNGSTSFTYSAVDNQGLSDATPATATIIVNPVASQAVISDGAGSVKEDTPTQTTTGGTLSITDPDAGEAGFQPQANVAGTYGSFSLDAVGHWTYTLDNTNPLVQALREGETRTDSFTIHSIDGTSATVAVLVNGTLDTTTASLSASGSVVEGGTITYTATLSDAAQGPVTLNLSNGAVISIADGALSGTVSVAAPADDVYLDSGSLAVTIGSMSGGNFENLAIDTTPAVTQVSDTLDATSLSLTGTSTVTEGNHATYNLMLTQVAQTPVTVTIGYSGVAANGADITGATTLVIAAGTSGVSFDVDTLVDGLAEGTESFTVSIVSATGGNFENLVIDASAKSLTTNLLDLDTATVSLTATPSLSEAGGTLVYTATSTQAPVTDLTISLSNGQSIVIAAGQLSGSTSLAVPGSDDVYIDPSNLSAVITGTTGGGISVAVNNAPAITSITDTIDTTTLTLSAAGNVAEGGNILYTATLSNAAQGPVTVNLSNGSVITIADGATTGTVSVPVHSETVYVDAGSVSNSITSATGGNFEDLSFSSAPVTTVITDTPDTTTLILSAGTSVQEGGSIVYTATLSNVAQGPVTVNLSNGSVITIANGATFGTVSVPVHSDTVYVDTGSVSASIASATGGNFEDLSFSSALVATAITDTPDTTTLALSADTSVQEGGNIVYTATLTNAAQGPVTVNLSNGSVITIANGATSGTVSVPVHSDTVYVDDGSVSASITSATGGNFEDLSVSTAPVATIITDTPDTTTLTLNATGSVAEGGNIIYTATLTNAAQGPVTVNLSNGSVITIANGATSGTVSVPVHSDTVYVDNGSVSTSITSTTGGNFEDLSFSSAPVTTIITDTPDTTTLTLNATGSVAEGGNIIYTATLTNAAQGPVTVNLSNGSVITIANGATSGTVSVPVHSDTVYVDNGSVSASITSAAGGNFEDLSFSSTPVTTAITDTPDATTLSLSAANSVQEGAAIVYTATLTSAAQGAVTVNLSNGSVITIANGATTGTVSVPVHSDTIYVDTGSVSASIASASGGNFENLSFSSAPVTTTITDTPDITTLTLSADASVQEGGNIVYIATLSNAAQGSVTVNLSNGSVITIADGATSGTVSIPVHSDTAYIDTGSVSASIASATGGNFENLSFSSAPVTTIITDTPDTTTLTLSADNSVQEGGNIVYTATLSNVAQGPVTVGLSNGSVIIIANGATTGTVSVPVHSDTVYVDAGSVSNSITSATGGNFENLSFSSAPVTTTITDIPDTTTLTLSADTSVQEGGSIVYTATLTNAAQGPVTVNLSNGSIITIANGATSGTVSIPVHSDTVYVDNGSVSNSITSATGGNFENLSFSSALVTTAITDTPDNTTLTLSADGSVAEGGNIIYTATLTNAAQGPVTVNLSNGSVITIADGATTGTVSVPAHSDTVYLDAGSVSNSITSATGGNFENLSFSSAPVTTIITDTPDTTTLTLSADASVQEGGNIVYTATLSNVAQGPVTVNLSNGSVITIANGATTGTVSVPAHSDTVYLDAGSVSNSITSATGGNFEDLSFSSAPVTTAITDIPDTTTLTLSADNSVQEGGNIVYTATLTNAAQGLVTVGLSNGSVITIADGATTGTVSVPVHSDTVYVDNGSVSNSIMFATGGNFEDLSFSVAPVVTTVTDTVNTTTLSLSATGSVQEGGSIVYTATLSNAAQGSVTVSLSNGSVITIANGATTGTVSVPVHSDTVYVDNGSVSNSIMSATGGNFEDLSFSLAPVTTTVTDTPDTTTLTLSADTSVQEGGNIVYTATLSNAAQGPVTVSLNNGSVITIANGATTGTVSVPVHSDTVYVDNGSISNSIMSATGGNFEDLSFSSAPVVTTVSDTINVTTLSLTGAASIAESSAGIYTLSLTNPAQTAVTVNLTYSGTATNGVDYTGVASVTIPAGSSSVNFSIQTLADSITEGNENFTVAIGSVSGGNFESLVVNGSATSVTTTIVDNHAPVAVADTASGSTGNLGLVSEYFGYREGTDGANLTNLSQIFAFISGRTPDATFTAKTFDYGAANTFNNNLGFGTNLQTFLGSDASTLSADPADTSDAIIHMRGFVQLAAGSYNFRVLGDDGYQVKVDGVVVAESNKNQSPTTTVHAQFTLGTGGLHNIEVVYWDQGGNASFKLELSNDSGTTYNLLSSIPTYKSAGWAVVEDTPTSFTKASLLANDTDSDGDSLSITSVQGAVHGSVAMVGSNVVFTPDANYNGPASFTYTISDGRGGSDTATVNLSVTPVNDAPVAVNDSARTNVGTALTLTATSLTSNDSDVDLDTLSITSVQGAVNGTVNMSGSNVTFTPTAGFEGNGSFTYTIKDLEGASSTATVSVAVGTAQAVSVVTEKFLAAIEHAGAATSISLPIVTALVDTDGSESLSIKLTGVPSGATLNHGTYDAANSAWNLSSADLDSLTLNLPANYSTGSGFVTLTAQVTTTEMYGGYTATTSSSFKLFAASTTSDLTATTSGSVTGTGANEYINGGSGDNNLSGANGNDIIYGLAGNDTISGGNGVDMLYGGLGNDSISGDAGSDRISGGAGNDTLTGGSDGSVDVFAWSLGDQGAAGTPAVDTITDFGTAAAGSTLSSGGDILDLRDLLSGDHVGPSNGAGNLADYLHFEISGANTIIHVSHTGDFTADSHTVSGSYTSSVETQQIVLTGVNLSTLYGGATTDAAIITNLLNNNKLITD